jgi:transposase
MSVRPFSRQGQWLLPPLVDELIPSSHPARFVAAFVDQLDAGAWRGLGVVPGGEKEGAPAYHPALLLSVWLYGFMSKVRSSRRLETACREQLPYLWLTGGQRPDHNTLWRFYKQHRQDMRKLLKLTVRTAVALDLVDLAVQAVDGTKIAGNASPDKTYNQERLARLLERVDAAIADLEAQNATGGDEPASHLPKSLQAAKDLQAKIKEALETVQADGHRSYINLTDEDAALLKGRGGYVVGYNAQTMASPLKGSGGASSGQFITAVEVVNEADAHQLLPLIAAAEANTDAAAIITLADAGYHSGANLVACEEESHRVVMPESQARALQSPYHKDAFTYDPDSDAYTCPRGEKLRYAGMKSDRGKERRWYRAQSPAACRACPAFGVCTKNKRHGRTLRIGPEEGALRRHRAWMNSAEATTVYKKRKYLIEPVFGIIKEQLLGTRRLLLRGLANVRAEWSLLAVAFNLRVLARLWATRRLRAFQALNSYLCFATAPRLPNLGLPGGQFLPAPRSLASAA